MTPEFETYIAPARERSQLWRVLCVLLIWVFGTMVSSFGIIFGMLSIFGDSDSFAILETAKFNTPLGMLSMLATFVGWVGALVIAVWIMHKRGLRSLLGPDAQLLVLFFAISFIGFGIFALILGMLFPEEKEIVSNLDFGTWLFFLFPGVLLMLVQVSAEELLFRGYFMQQLAVRFNNRLIYMGVPSIIFGLAHYDSSYGVATAMMIVGSAALLGLFLADLTYRTGNLGAAIGIHFANNFAAIFWTSYQESASGLALNRVPYYFENPQALGDALLIYMSVSGVLFAIYWQFMERRARNRLQSD